MRLHFLIFAALRATPFAALPYASKVEGLLDDLGIASPPLSAIGVGQLIARIDRAWDARQALREQIRTRLPALKARAAATNELLLQLLRRELPATGPVHH
jgi:polysaccharide pyruvyl transferase WcaK-like protein